MFSIHVCFFHLQVCNKIKCKNVCHHRSVIMCTLMYISKYTHTHVHSHACRCNDIFLLDSFVIFMSLYQTTTMYVIEKNTNSFCFFFLFLLVFLLLYRKKKEERDKQLMSWTCCQALCLTMSSPSPMSPASVHTLVCSRSREYLMQTLYYSYHH